MIQNIDEEVVDIQNFCGLRQMLTKITTQYTICINMKILYNDIEIMYKLTIGGVSRLWL